MFDNKSLLITGGTGSFGNAVLQRILQTSVNEVRIFSRDEKKQEDMRISLQSEKVKFYVGDVRDYDSVVDATYGVDYIFHAAALKQVPSCEFYPLEAVKTNILGADNVMRAAIANKIKRVVVLSTDKAVYPINAMGISKAMMERVMISKARQYESHNTIFCATRYGNVMASRGSVIPLFLKQLLDGQPLTITDPLMTRFLMSLEDSVELVFHAFKNGEPGDIFVQKSPATTMAILAKAMTELLQKKDQTKVIGTRHGEKLFESLVSREEMVRSIDLGKYFKIPSDNRNLNYDKYFATGTTLISEIDDYTSHNTKQLDIIETKEVLMGLDIIKKELK